MDTKQGLFQSVVQFFDTLHIALPGMFAGAAGGFVYLIRLTKITAWLVAVCVGSGALTAGYVAWPMVHYLKMPESYSPAVGFLIGLFGMPITAFLITAIREATKNPLGIIFKLIPGLRGLVPEKTQSNGNDNNENIQGKGEEIGLGEDRSGGGPANLRISDDPEQGRRAKREARKRNQIDRSEAD